MGVYYKCICGKSVTLSSGEHDMHQETCPAHQPASPTDIGKGWLIALAGLVLACCLWGSP